MNEAARTSASARALRLVLPGLMCLALARSLALAAKEMRLTLRFTPRENVTANVPSTDKASPVRPIDVRPLIDARSIPDLSLVGENRERRVPKPVRATSSVADFATQVLKKCLSEWGVRLGTGLTLSGEITNLLVTEENTYSTAVNIRFQLEDESSNVLWTGIATGDAHQWGRSFSEENYNEQISDALKRTFAHLLSNPGFQAAWAGKRSDSHAEAVAPAEVKSKVLEMIKADVGENVIVSYVRGVRLSSKLTAEEIVDWKKSGIPERVIEAAITEGQR